MAKIDAFFNLMFEQKASDLHLCSGNNPMLRINGELQRVDHPPLENDELKKMLYEIAPEYKIKVFEETGDVDFGYEIPNISRFRANFFNQKYGIAAVFRQIPSKVLSFEDFEKFNAPLPAVLKKFSMLHRGLVVVTGPTGSGKSTTLAAMVEHINANFKKHVITMEDPIEYVFEDNQCIVEQREVGLDTLSFHHALKHVLRQDPDIIMIGEMRDAISFTAAMSAADTGHLVLSTLHTTNASQSIGRILDFFKADEREQIRRQLAGTLQAVVCQRMVTTVAGGMTPALEIMVNTATVKKLIEENRLDKLQAAIETGTDDGMINFNQALFQLVKDGKVTEKEALAKATNPQALEMNFKGIFLDEGKRILS
jgi:twitching motility protein PilT